MEFVEVIEGLGRDELVSMLENEREKRIALEEECDLLAMENHMLRYEPFHYHYHCHNSLSLSSFIVIIIIHCHYHHSLSLSSFIVIIIIHCDN